jgi:hypothetical protein
MRDINVLISEAKKKLENEIEKLPEKERELYLKSKNDYFAVLNRNPELLCFEAKVLGFEMVKKREAMPKAFWKK